MIIADDHLGHKLIKTVLVLLLFFILCSAIAPQPIFAGGKSIMVAPVNGTITPGKMAFLERIIRNSEKADAELLVIVLDTPGGLVEATTSINTAILNARLPVAVLVAPSGAIAASAGSFIVMSSDIAAMAPGTTIGAAQPITFSLEGVKEAGEKTTKFLSKHLRNLAEEKGRPPDIAEKFITENLSLSSREALEEGVIEYLASDLHDLLEQLHGQSICKHDRIYVLDTDNPLIKAEGLNISEQVQNWLSDPRISFLLLILGVLGLFFGFSNPGTMVPEVLGGIMLILGIYGTGMFEAATTGVILMLLGAGLIIAEIFVPGFGILGVGGGLSLLVGALLLPQEPLMDAHWYIGFRQTVIVVAIAVIVITLLAAQRVIYYRKNRYTDATFLDAPRKGLVIKKLAPEGMIRAQGEIWIARSDDGKIIENGTEVEVVRAESTMLWVREANKPDKAE